MLRLSRNILAGLVVFLMAGIVPAVGQHQGSRIPGFERSTGLNEQGLYIPGSSAPNFSLQFASYSTGAELSAKGVTFSRPGNAMQYDSTGKLTWAPNNLVLNGATLSGWTLTGATAAIGVSDPQAGTQAVTVTATTANNDVYYTFGLMPASPTIVSVWVRRRTGSGAITMFSATGGPSVIVPTGTWQQFYVYQNSLATAWYFEIRMATSGDQIDIYMPVLATVTYETTPRAVDQVINTSAAYYGPRFDFDPVTHAAKGLLIEESRTNLATYSEDFSDASWSKTATVTPNAAIAPNGTTTADKIIPANGTSSGQLYKTVTVTAGVDYTTSVYVEKAGASYATVGLIYSAGIFAAVQYNLDTLAVANSAGGGGSTVTSSSIKDVGNGRFRISVTTKHANTTAYPSVMASTTAWTSGPPDGANTGDGTSGIYAWGFQFELGAFATSYIPTTSASVTRAADAVSITGTAFSSFYNQSEGTFVVEATSQAPTVLDHRYLLAASDGTASNVLEMRGHPGGIYNFTASVAGVGQVNLTSGTPVPNVFAKNAYAYKLNDYAGATNGGTVTTDTTATVPTVNRLDIGSYAGGGLYLLNGWIRSLDYFNTRRTNAELVTLATP